MDVPSGTVDAWCNSSPNKRDGQKARVAAVLAEDAALAGRHCADQKLTKDLREMYCKLAGKATVSP